MDKRLRIKFNAEFKQENYDSLIDDINRSTDNKLDFKICETPLFLTKEFTEELVKAGEEINQIIQQEDFLKTSSDAVPEKLFVPNEDDHPIFLQLDFGITMDDKGNYIPQLIELQGFPSLYCYQLLLDQKVREHFNIPANMTTYFNNYDFDSFIELFKKVLIDDCEPENAVLLEIEPQKQKTRIDFFLTEKYTGIKTLCVTDVIKDGNSLYYFRNGAKVKIKRIYNRVIFDELVRRNMTLNFSFTDKLDVKWIGHPNWFYKISKFSLPQIKSKYNPPSYYLSELEEIPGDLENYVLKPLFSFAGSGVIIDVTSEVINSIENKSNYILQRKVEYVPLIETPDGMSKAEIRLMYIWDKSPVLVNNLLRSSKGKMMGVDYNKNQSWIGSNTIYHPA